MKFLTYFLSLSFLCLTCSLSAVCDDCRPAPLYCSCQCTCDEEVDEWESEPATLLYFKGGARWYPSEKVVWPSFGVGWRCHCNGRGFDLSVSTAHPTMNKIDFKHYYNIAVKALAITYLYPDCWSSLYWGAGIGMDHHHIMHCRATAGTLEAMVGYEFPFCCRSQAFLQLEVSQPIYEKRGFQLYDLTSISLMLGIGY